ncbi:hypothetical protein NQ318_008475 [Aromia moschata]|uniref:Enoyl reductase (ER) domain-containing protein n=1 Tax=Aromia moschata TaxID=1265417 RepID=A0AAV8Y9B3_9CUCU|nr:hypothetical protein NQ318_008475 [Aromia moschata]
MDELAFRSSQKIETIQLQAQLTASKTKDVLVFYSQQTKQLFAQFLNSKKAEQLKTFLKEVSDKVLIKARDVQGVIIYHANPQQIYRSIIRVFGKKWTKRDIYFGCAGLFIGIVIGISIGLAVRKKEPVVRYMQAVQCNQYLGCESVTIVEDAIASYECGEYDVLVNVKAASIQIIDVNICNGYGRTLRKILQRIYNSRSDLPVVLGRDCTGIVTDIGSKVKRLEVGDEVWLAVPFWSQGTLSQTVLIAENRIARKPKNIGFEGASSLPYAGSLALSALGEANLDASNSRNKRILVVGGCTPVGCVLIQLLKHWKAIVATTCYKKAVPVVKALGASEIITSSETPLNSPFLETTKLESEHISNNGLLKELEVRGDIYDVIIQTDNSMSLEALSKYCKQSGAIISTLPPPLASDSCGFFSEIILSLYVQLKYELQASICHFHLVLLGLPINDFDETHLCYIMLDKLTEFVEDGYLQTVVDKVCVPEDIEQALNHIQSPQSIGSTIMTFR